MYPISTFALIAASITFRATPTLAQSDSSTNKTCNANSDSDFNQARLHPNATGSYTGPGFSSNTSTDDVWIYNISIHVTEGNQIWQDFSVDTPSLKGVKDSDNPFQLCAIAFNNLPRSTYIKGQQDSGDCNHTLNPACTEALRSLASSSSGVGVSNGDDIHEGGALCANIMSQLAQGTPSACQQFGNFENATSSTLFSKSAADSSSCPAKSDNTVHSLSPISTGPFNTTALNLTDYDEAIYRVTPLLITVIKNEWPGNGTFFFSSDTEVLCMRATDITAGSRDPPPLQDTTSTPAAPGPSPTAHKGGSSDNSPFLGVMGVLGLVMAVILV